MAMIEVPKYSVPHGVALVVIGTMLLLFIHVGGLLGLIVVPFGLVVLFSKKRIWSCLSCRAVADRVEHAPPRLP
jgi:hypothetical protein